MREVGKILMEEWKDASLREVGKILTEAGEGGGGAKSYFFIVQVNIS